MQFQRSISSVGLLFAAVGGIVGSGWLFGPMYAAQQAGPAAILSWVIGGVLMMFIALTFAELATTNPLSGGMVRFAQMSHGPVVSFTIGWMVWLSSVAVAPIETMALIQYASSYLPGLTTKISGVTLLTSTGIVLSAFVMLFMCVLNFYGAKFISRTNTAVGTFKLLVPVLTLLILLVADFHPSNFTATSFMPYGWHGVLAALPLGGVIFSFIGYSPAIQLAGEAKNPQRTIPFAIIGSIIICIGLYVVLQTAFVGALKPEFFAHGWRMLSFPGDSGPFAGILMGLGFSIFVLVIYADAIISPFGTAFIYTSSTARVNYALSKVGFFPAFFLKLTKRGAPMRAIAVNYVIGLILFLPFPGWQELVGFLVSCFVIAYSIGPLSLVVLRRKNPDQERPFKLPAATLISAIAFYICNLLIYWTGWNTVHKLLIALVIGFVWYVVHEYREGKSSPFLTIKNAAWLLIYLIGLGILSFLGAFGGRDVISFGWDFIVIAIFSLIIFWFATHKNNSLGEV